MQLFFSNTVENQVTFTLEENKHLTKVLRKKINDEVFIIDGKGYLYTGKIICQDKKSSTVEITNREKKEKTHKYYLHIGLAPTKNISRFEWFLEKATEIGIDEITPLICEKSERKTINFNRCEKILITAIKQSLKYHLPKLNNPISFNNFIKDEKLGDKFIAHCKEGKKIKLDKKAKEKYVILIGPEGDFSQNEIDLAITRKYLPITLGNSRLRTETAGIVASHSVNLNF
tara:strand:- start:144 stop:833 length:690 start_codon:yes stop_codon:yes gene_type:complete